jgi:rfaE bifunctional protein kinase chain/domain
VSPERFETITRHYANLRIGVVGDFCLDRYLEIDPGKSEISIETNLPVHNVVRVRSQPGGAGTILNNLVALGVQTLYPLGFAGEDGEGYELVRSLREKQGVKMDYFMQTADRRTFTYCKPLILQKGEAPKELNRLDSKNWTATPAKVSAQFIRHLEALANKVDAIIALDQVDIAESGVITAQVMDSIRKVSHSHPQLFIMADSRRGLKGFPPVTFKMNAAELAKFGGKAGSLSLDAIRREAATLASKNGRSVFVTMAADGIVGASPLGEVEHVRAWPVRGEIDVVGAGDAVTANVTCAMAAGASLREALELANTAASIVVHQLGTTGTANGRQLQSLLFSGSN